MLADGTRDHERQRDDRRAAARDGAADAAALDGAPARPARRAARWLRASNGRFPVRRRRSEGPDRGGSRRIRCSAATAAERFARPVADHGRRRLAGVVVVPPQAPFGFLLGRFAPMLGAGRGGVLIVGTVLASAMIFGPARRRLRSLETAARRLGAGDLAARAPDRGGDEIAAVASAFNAMADDLSARAEALAASDRVRRQLLADVSHELTTPVTAMRGYLETLTMPELALDEATRGRYLAIIGDETSAARADHRRAARPGAARRRRRSAARSNASSVARAVRRASPRGTSTRCAAAGVVLAIDDRARGDRSRRRRSRSTGAGAAEPRRQRDPLRAARHRRFASRARTVAGGIALSVEDAGATASPRSTCRTSSIASTRRTRRGSASKAAAGSGCRSSRRSSSGTAARYRWRAVRDGRSSRWCCRRAPSRRQWLASSPRRFVRRGRQRPCEI